MINLGELREHEDFPKLVNELDFEIDNRTKSVVAASSNKSLEEIRFAAGGLDALISFRRVLVAKKKRGR